MIPCPQPPLGCVKNPGTVRKTAAVDISILELLTLLRIPTLEILVAHSDIEPNGPNKIKMSQILRMSGYYFGQRF